MAKGKSLQQTLVGCVVILYSSVFVTAFGLYCCHQYYTHRKHSAIQRRQYRFVMIWMVAAIVYIFMNGLRGLEWVLVPEYMHIVEWYTIMHCVYVYIKNVRMHASICVK